MPKLDLTYLPYQTGDHYSIERLGPDGREWIGLDGSAAPKPVLTPVPPPSADPASHSTVVRLAVEVRDDAEHLVYLHPGPGAPATMVLSGNARKPLRPVAFAGVMVG